jgi:hypothetical protein
MSAVQQPDVSGGQGRLRRGWLVSAGMLLGLGVVLALLPDDDVYGGLALSVVGGGLLGVAGIGCLLVGLLWRRPGAAPAPYAAPVQPAPWDQPREPAPWERPPVAAPDAARTSPPQDG